jgi:hypothetical protein
MEPEKSWTLIAYECADFHQMHFIKILSNLPVSIQLPISKKTRKRLTEFKIACRQLNFIKA